MHITEPDKRNVETEMLQEIARACACANLRKAARTVTQIFDEALSASGLKATQFTLLVTVRLVGETTIRELADTMVMDRTTLSRNLGPLVREGLLDVRPGEDGRVRLVRVTREGEKTIGEAYPLWQKAQEVVVEALGEERYRALLGDLALTVARSNAS